MIPRSRYWEDLVELLDRSFPKGECKERGNALVMLARIEMLLSGMSIKDILK